MAKKATKKAKATSGGISHRIHTRGKKSTVIRRFVPRDIITIPWGKPITETEIVRYLTNGYEVRIGSVKSGIRLFPYLNNDYETQRIVAQTHGYFRDAIKDCPWNEAGEVKHDTDNLIELGDSRKKLMRDGYRLAGITPDTMVECPNCGTTFRVGKKLV